MSKLSANVVKSIQVCGFRLQPLRLAVPRRLLALACWLIEHHIAPLQPDVIKPEARYVQNACGPQDALLASSVSLGRSSGAR